MCLNILCGEKCYGPSGAGDTGKVMDVDKLMDISKVMLGRGNVGRQMLRMQKLLFSWQRKISGWYSVGRRLQESPTGKVMLQSLS